MKKILVVLVLGVMMLNANAQTNVIKFNPLGLAFGYVNLSYEKTLSTKAALQINASLTSLDLLGTKYSGIGIGVDYRLYLSPTKEAPRGMYFAPGLSFSSLTVENGSDKGTGSVFALKGVLGHQWVWKSGFSLDLYGGVSYYLNGDISLNGTSYGKFNGLMPALGVCVGYGW
jgi:hypothetical protein